ncbi:MAG: hypothetical protein GSR77_00890 [Desulfurococcales archaeon]|nr:hypothetical protein [Desulfurococcales archaeon]MEB3764711.1 hypothetical protein [Desulfurococcales archaeon]
MKLLEVIMWQCELIRKLEAEDYLGVSLRRCPEKIEHIIVSDNKVKNVNVRCENCILAKLMKSTHIIGSPTIVNGGKIRFVVKNNASVKKLLKEHSYQLVEIKEVDHRELYLTRRQKEVLSLLVSGRVSNATQLSRLLKISKPAALKLIKRSIRKLARRHID